MNSSMYDYLCEREYMRKEAKLQLAGKIPESLVGAAKSARKFVTDKGGKAIEKLRGLFTRKQPTILEKADDAYRGAASRVGKAIADTGKGMSRSSIKERAADALYNSRFGESASKLGAEKILPKTTASRKAVRETGKALSGVGKFISDNPYTAGGIAAGTAGAGAAGGYALARRKGVDKKASGDVDQVVPSMTDRLAELAHAYPGAATGAGIGLAGGALGGLIMAKENKLRNAALAGIISGVLGGAAGYGYDKYVR